MRSKPILTTIAALVLGGCTRTSAGWIPVRCAHLDPHVVATERQAILAARKIWYCAFADDGGSSEESWLVRFRAQRIHGVWHVINVYPEGYVGPTFYVQLEAKDARLVDLRFGQ